jgi:hypothetical protein
MALEITVRRILDRLYRASSQPPPSGGPASSESNQPPTTPNLNQIIRGEVERLLLDKQIFTFRDYGTLPYPIFAGYTLWQRDRPLLPSGHMLSPEAYQRSDLLGWQRSILMSGADFEGLVDAARLSIGLALVDYGSAEQSIWATDTFFHLHVMTSMILLGAASDRLRDLFVGTVFKKTAEEYARGKFNEQNRTWYVTPFNEATGCASEYGDPVANSLETLPNLAERVQKFRMLRNEIVHDIGTKFGHRQKENVNVLHTMRTGGLRDVEIRILDEEESKVEHRKTLDEEVSRPIAWFKLLISMGSYVFVVENQLRKRALWGEAPAK